MIEWSQKSRPKKIPGSKINPKKSQAKEIKSLLSQKGIPVTVKPIDWIEGVDVLYTAGHHGTMKTIVQCKQQQNTFVCTLFAELRSQGTTDSF